MNVFYEGKVVAPNQNAIRIRANPSLEGTVLLAVPVGSDIVIIEELDDWFKIDYMGQQGYMMKKFIEKSEVEPLSVPEVKLKQMTAKISGLLESLKNIMQ